MRTLIEIIIVMPLWLIGLLTVVYWAKKPKSPADDSNRINNIVSWWIGLTRPEVLAKYYRFFRNDVMENVRIVYLHKKGADDDI